MANSQTISLQPSKKLRGLPPPEFLDLTEIRKQRCKTNFYEFLKEFWDTVCSEPLKDNWHIKYICDELQDLSRYVIAREQPPYNHLVINVPPGTSKSTIVSILWPVWLWLNDSTLNVISTSYAFDAAEPHSQKSKDCIKSDKFREWYGHLFQIRHDIDNKKIYVTDKMGMRITTSSGGTITGKHANVIIVDDAHKIPDAKKEQAGATAVEMASDVDWHFTSLNSRKIDLIKVPTVVVMQRVSENDLCAAIFNKGIKYKHIRLPATSEYDIHPPELSAHYVGAGGLLDPVRLSNEALDQQRVLMGSYGFAGQYGQVPAPPEGGIIKMAWIKKFTKNEIPENLPVNFYLDTAYTEKAGNDPSCILAYSIYKNNLYILGISVVRLGLPEFLRHCVSYCNSMGITTYSKVHVEPKATGISVAQTLKVETNFNVMLETFPTGMTDKVNRVQAQVAKIEAGRVYVLGGAHWAESFIAECGRFPNGGHDDQVDCLTGAMRMGLGSGIDYSGFG